MIVHVSSQARPGEREAGCPCAKAACGSVVIESPVSLEALMPRAHGKQDCHWHGPWPIAPFMGWHRAEDCPAAPQVDVPTEVRGVMQAARDVRADSKHVPKGLAGFVEQLLTAGWELHSLHLARGEILQKRLGPPDSEGKRKQAIRPTVVTSVVARMSKGYARAVMVYEGGTAAAGWRRRTWASNWEEIGVRALQSWAVGQ